MKKSIGMSLIKLLGFTAVTAGVVIVGVNVVTNYTNKKNSINPNNQSEQYDVSKGELAVKINSILNFEKATSSAEANIVNNIKNSYDMIVKIYDENENLIYTSLKIKPGEEIKEIKLDKVITVGQHKATAYFEAYDNENYVGKTGTVIKINVKN